MTMLRSFSLKPAQPIYLIIALAFLIRLGWIVFAPALPISDFAWYDQVAGQVVQGRGYSVGGSPTAFRVPGYPLFLAGIYMMFERSLFFAKLASVLLGTLTVFLVYLLGRRRNYRVFDRLVPLATDGGINLLVSFNEKSVGRFVPGVHAHIEERARQEGWDKEQLEQAILEEALDFIRRHPVRAIGLAPLKVFHLFRDDVSGVIWNFSETSRPLPQWLR